MIQEVKLLAAFCDDCKESLEGFDGQSAWGTQKEVLDTMDDYGWATQDEKHFCPSCQEKTV